MNRIAHSDLCELFNLRMGKPARSIDEKAARFGTTFHSMILEPEKPIDWTQHHVTERAKLLEMEKSFRDLSKTSILARDMIAMGQREKVVQWMDTSTGLPLKAKLDAHYATPLERFGKQVVIDLKTTSCESSYHFFNRMIEYGYDRQAAFYLDAVGSDYNFYFVAIQKRKPFDVFEINMAFSVDRRAIIDQARAKNARLLRDAYQELQKPDGWRPSSWSRIEQEPISTLRV
ncbi:PD-(D/E)XK nuclease-like domain-containing protein [Spirosoma aerolatum]|uniref:PD-(D/E)XK nuclease-like domain-containing protein n=1 Tax=Spirosoma aerolatum TaxID=1211326 RepID=UPI001475DE4E|nr:PD-(D/E)XK nuclease-like domain-containing protein [Spirosoma aerolatum]